jgi:CubicO group peptidase (beta-lactamase class C family)
MEFVRGGLLVATVMGIVACTGSSGAGETSEISAAVETCKELYSECENRLLPGGYAIAVIKDGRVVFKKAEGYASTEHQVPFRTSTIFDFASVAKQFTGMAIAMLVQDGKLSLDDDIRSYLPEMPDYGIPITVRHLAYHTSGIRDWVALVKISGQSLENVITDDFLYKLAINQKELNFPPGERFLYSNTNYFLLAKIVEKATGVSFPEWMRTHIFEPLHMNNTLILDQHGRIVPNLASCYVRDQDNEYQRSASSLTSYGSSSLLSTVDDMVKWLLNFEEGIVGGEEVFEIMQQDLTLRSGENVHHGIGLSIQNWRGLRNYVFGGSWRGYVCSTFRFPEQRFSLVFVANRRPSGCYAENEVIEAFLGHLGKERSSADREGASPALSSIDISNQVLNRYVGVYAHAGRVHTYEVFSVERSGSQLVLRGDKEYELVPVDQQQFRTLGLDRHLTFRTGRNGRIVSLEIQTPRQLLQLEKKDFRPLAGSELGKIAGNYWCDELKTAYTVEVEDEKLVCQHFYNEDVVLTQKLDDYFESDNWWFRDIQIERDLEGRVTGFRLGADYNQVQNLRFVRRQ